ncbi:MAG: DUF1064 domain-containing protein [Bacteroides sp.]
MSSKDLSRLGPAAQKQVFQKLGKQQRNRETRTPGKNKYNAKPTDVFMSDGTVRRFDSIKEAERFKQLDLLQRIGKITGLKCQVPFELVPHQKREDGKTEQPVKYIADFVYYDGCRCVVEDVKGYKDTGSAAYKLFTVKRKLMLQRYGITIKEV